MGPGRSGVLTFVILAGSMEWPGQHSTTVVIPASSSVVGNGTFGLKYTRGLLQFWPLVLLFGLLLTY